MEHTKKFVLMDPRFARPSMRDKALSALDSEMSSILENEDSDEIKARNYEAALIRFRNYLKPPVIKRDTLPTVPPPPQPAPPPPQPKPVRKRTKRVKNGSLDSAANVSSVSWDQFSQPDSTHDASLWSQHSEKKSQDKSKKKKKKQRKTWVQY